MEEFLMFMMLICFICLVILSTVKIYLPSTLAYTYIVHKEVYDAFKAVAQLLKEKSEKVVFCKNIEYCRAINNSSAKSFDYDPEKYYVFTDLYFTVWKNDYPLVSSFFKPMCKKIESYYATYNKS